MTKTRAAWFTGATGLVGREAVLALLEAGGFERVLTLVRRPSALTHPRLDERVIDFETLSSALTAEHADVAICCLGSTIKQAGSQEQFRHIDYNYALSFARAAQAAGARSTRRAAICSTSSPRTRAPYAPSSTPSDSARLEQFAIVSTSARARRPNGAKTVRSR